MISNCQFGFFLQISRIVLNDTKGVDPQVLVTKFDCDIDGVLETYRKRIDRHRCHELLDVMCRKH